MLHILAESHLNQCYLGLVNDYLVRNGQLLPPVISVPYSISSLSFQSVSQILQSHYDSISHMICFSNTIRETVSLSTSQSDPERSMVNF